MKHVFSTQLIDCSDREKFCFSLICKECGSEKQFSEKYDITIWYDDGSRKDINLKSVAKDYFKL